MLDSGRLGELRRYAAAACLVAALGGCNQGPDADALMAQAAQARASGRIDAAIIHLKNAVQATPEHAEVRFQLGTAYLDAEDYESARKELERARELGYDPARLAVPLARALVKLGDHRKVLDQVEAPTDADNAVQAQVIALRGWAALGLQRHADARTLFEQALARQPELPDALLGQASLLLVERRFKDAETLIERSIAAAPARSDAWLMKGDLHRSLRMGDPAAAYRKVLELHPTSVPARLGLLSLAIGRNDLAEAETLLADATKRAPRNTQVKYAEALLEYRKKNYPAARAAVLKVLEVAPDHGPAVVLAGAIEHALGANLQAQAYLSRAIEQAPGNLFTRRLLVSSLARSGQTQQALEALAPALAQAPNDVTMIGMAGELAMQAGDYRKAREYFEKASKLAPKNERALTGLASSRHAEGDAPGALMDLEAATRLDTQSGHAEALLVVTHLQNARFDQALKAAQALAKKQPQNPLTYNLKAAAHLGNKDIASARIQLERALSLQPDFLPAALNLAHLDLRENKAQDARRRLEAILDKEPRHAQALLALGNLAPQLNASMQEQQKWLERAAEASPRSSEARLALARFHLQNGAPEKALDGAQQAVAAHPDDPTVLLNLGAIQLAVGERNQAVDTYRRLVRLAPKSHVALHHLARAQAATGDTSGAVSSLRRALALAPGDLDAQALLAEIDLRAARYTEALATARKLQAQAPKSPLGHVAEGDVAMARGNAAQAIRAYAAAYALEPSSGLATKLHAAHVRADQPDEGHARLAAWLQRAPDDAAVRRLLADSSLKRGRARDAAVHYERLLEKRPDDLAVLNNLALAYQQAKDPRALATAERAHAARPDNPIVADTLGWILVEQGNTGRGIDLLQKAAAGAPKAPEIRYHLAQAFLKAGNEKQARDELERALAGGEAFAQQAEAHRLLEDLRRRRTTPVN